MSEKELSRVIEQEHSDQAEVEELLDKVDVRSSMSMSYSTLLFQKKRASRESLSMGESFN